MLTASSLDSIAYIAMLMDAATIVKGWYKPCPALLGVYLVLPAWVVCYETLRAVLFYFDIMLTFGLIALNHYVAVRFGPPGSHCLAPDFPICLAPPGCSILAPQSAPSLATPSWRPKTTPPRHPESGTSRLPPQRPSIWAPPNTPILAHHTMPLWLVQAPSGWHPKDSSSPGTR